MMRFEDLEPRWLGEVDVGERSWRELPPETGPASAQGVFFLCPVCFATNSGPVGTHGILCWTPQVPAAMQPGPGRRWHLRGSSFADLTLAGVGSDSVLLTSGCRAHFFVRGGIVEVC
ncbi:MAG: hypothetical protein KIT14_22555 [bacterium]|nr:hypothetical protein [bacterium]